MEDQITNAREKLEKERKATGGPFARFDNSGEIKALEEAIKKYEELKAARDRARISAEAESEATARTFRVDEILKKAKPAIQTMDDLTDQIQQMNKELNQMEADAADKKGFDAKRYAQVKDQLNAATLALKEYKEAGDQGNVTAERANRVQATLNDRMAKRPL